MAADLAEREHALVDLAKTVSALTTQVDAAAIPNLGSFWQKRHWLGSPPKLASLWQIGTGPQLHPAQSPRDARRRLVRQ